MKIGVVGCCHGELNKIYDVINYIEETKNIKLDLLICCGDFQAFRNISDMKTMAAPEKYQEMKDFHEYYTGKRKAPVVTLFIGGNHESATYLWELPYGGWVAENIYYMGFAGVINFGGLRIGGLSGIYKSHDYYKGHFEKPPFNEETKRSFYHVRSCDVAKLKLLHQKEIDIFLSHDWPLGIYNHGNWKQLVKFKPFFREEIEKDILGSPPSKELLDVLKPSYWFAGHMHAKFVALVDHSNDSETKFLALSKCLPKKDFLQILDIGASNDEKIFKFDPEWISILQKNNNVYSTSSKTTFLTELDEDNEPTEFEIESFLSSHKDLNVFPFKKSVNGVNDQTSLFCEKFDVFNPCTKLHDSVISNNSHGSSQKRHKKLSIPKPSVKLNKNKLPSDNQNISSSSHVDEFDDLVNPNSLNPDEINISESENSDSDSNSDSESNTESHQISSTGHLSSMIESPAHKPYQSTPFKKIQEHSLLSNSTTVSESSEIESPEKTSTGSSEDVANNTPLPKKFKLVRRNRQIYENTEEE